MTLTKTISLLWEKEKPFGSPDTDGQTSEPMNEVFFYDPYKKTDMDITLESMHSITLAVKAFGATCKQAMNGFKEMNDAMQYMGRCSGI